MDQKQRRRFLFLGGAFALPLLWIMLIRILALGGAENSLDAFYHIRVAETGAFLAREFPALQLSVWCENFADKEFLSHGILWLLTRFRAVCAPFHIEYGVFLLLLLGSFCWTARMMNIRARMIFAGALLPLLLTISGAMRLTMLRPHLLSLTLLFAAFGILGAKKSLRFRSLGMLCLAFVYTWSYSNPHFIILPAVLFALLNWKGREWLPVLTAAVGVVLGLLIHPQTPETFLIWKIQSIDALTGPLSAAAQDLNRIPSELLPVDGRDFVTSIPLYIMAFLNLILMSRLLEKNGRKNVPVPVFAAAVFGILFTLAFFFVKRSMEYAAPFTVLGFIGLADAALRGDDPLWKMDWKKAAWGIFAVSLLIAGLTTWQFFGRGPRFEERTELRKYLTEQFTPGTVFLNPDWSDFPQLYYEAPHLRWQWGLDPSFSMAKDPRRTQLLTSSVRAEQLAALTGADYAVLLYPRHAFAEHLRRCGWVLLKDIPGEAWIFSNPDLKK